MEDGWGKFSCLSLFTADPGTLITVVVPRAGTPDLTAMWGLCEVQRIGNNSLKGAFSQVPGLCHSSSCYKGRLSLPHSLVLLLRSASWPIVAELTMGRGTPRSPCVLLGLRPALQSRLRTGKKRDPEITDYSIPEHPLLTWAILLHC